MTAWLTALFFLIDLIKAYHQIPIAKADVSKMAIAIPFSLFEFPSWFQPKKHRLGPPKPQRQHLEGVRKRFPLVT